jgi:hypothetical protein
MIFWCGWFFTALKAVNVRDKLRFALLCFVLNQFVVSQLVVSMSAQAVPHPPPPAQAPFTEKTASDMLLQLSEALQSHIEKKMLALFDLSHMKDGGLFRQQVNLLFTQTDSIRVHLNLVETAVENQRATLTIDAEMDLQLQDGPPARRNDRLTLVVANAGGSWKFVDVQPRSFFSLP